MNDSADRGVAVVIGAGGGLGAALVRQASQGGQAGGSAGAYQRVLALGRRTRRDGLFEIVSPQTWVLSGVTAR